MKKTVERTLLDDAYKIINELTEPFRKSELDRIESFNKRYRTYKLLRDNPIKIDIVTAQCKSYNCTNEVAAYIDMYCTECNKKCKCEGFFQPIECPIHRGCTYKT